MRDSDKDFEEVGELTSSEIFYKQKAPAFHDSDNQEWQNKLNLPKNEDMLNRKVEIYNTRLINDGYLSSHKEFLIRSWIEGNHNYQEISRRYSDFEWLVAQLINKYPGCIIPPLPEKNPLAKIDKEDPIFLETRKRGLLRFLEMMLQHQDLKNTPEFANFLFKSDSDFNSDVEKSKKQGSIMPTVSSIMENIPTAPVSFFSNIYSKFVEGDKIKKEKSDTDQKIDNHESYIGFLQSSLAELTEYANQMGTIEKEQSNTLLDLSNNLNKISEFDKNNKLGICKRLGKNTEECGRVQTEHASYFNGDLEIKLKELNSYVASAQSTIKRRNELSQIIEKDEAQLRQLYSHSNNPKYAELSEKNCQNKAHLQEMDSILLDELKYFEANIITEIDKVAREFMTHQTEYAKRMHESWLIQEN